MIEPLYVFVPNGDNRKETAILLVGTADEYGLSQRSVKAVSGGFMITERLAEIIYDQPEETPETPDEAPATTGKKKASGNRAAKNTVTEKE